MRKDEGVHRDGIETRAKHIEERKIRGELENLPRNKAEDGGGEQPTMPRTTEGPVTQDDQPTEPGEGHRDGHEQIALETDSEQLEEFGKGRVVCAVQGE